MMCVQPTRNRAGEIVFNFTHAICSKTVIRRRIHERVVEQIKNIKLHVNFCSNIFSFPDLTVYDYRGLFMCVFSF